MRESPRFRRLRADLRAMERLTQESSIVRFQSEGEPVDRYTVTFHGTGLWKPDGAADVLVRREHRVRVELGAAYPRMMPEIEWKTPIFHPNISAGGVVCLGGYGTHWVPSLNLDELCEMLWDMIRYRNYDVESPYNREAAAWARSQSQFRLPVDQRFIRDRLAELSPQADSGSRRPPVSTKPAELPVDEVIIIEDGETVVDAEVVRRERRPAPSTGPEDQDIVFLD